LERRLRSGMYPGVISSDDPAADIREIATSYLYHDLLEYQTVRNPDALRRLLQALALQSGNEVSFNELGQLLGIDKATVDRYVALLEQAFIIFQLPPFRRNLRKELGRLRKICFVDLGAQCCAQRFRASGATPGCRDALEELFHQRAPEIQPEPEARGEYFFLAQL